MTNTDDLPTTRIAELRALLPEQRWLVRHFWSREGVGVIGGLPKNSKTWLGLDVAVSVASGSRCLDRFEVEDPGPVLIYLAEDSLPVVRERSAGIAAHRGLDFERLDVHVITAPSLRLDLEPDQRRLRATLKRIRPKLLLLDPAVRLHQCDENSSREMALFLGFLRQLQREYAVAVILVHHLGKKSHTHLGQGLRGSGDLHAWGDDNAYLTRRPDHLLLTLEHRAAPSIEPVRLRLVQSESSHIHLQTIDDRAKDVEVVTKTPLPERILAALLEFGPGRAVARTTLRDLLRINNQRLGDALSDLEQRRLVERSAQGWALPVSDQAMLGPRGTTPDVASAAAGHGS